MLCDVCVYVCVCMCVCEALSQLLFIGSTPMHHRSMGTSLVQPNAAELWFAVKAVVC